MGSRFSVAANPEKAWEHEIDADHARARAAHIDELREPHVEQEVVHDEPAAHIDDEVANAAVQLRADDVLRVANWFPADD